MDSPWRIESLPDLETRIWEKLHAAACEPGAAWRTPTLATAGPDGTGVDARVMVLRKVDRSRCELVCHTDSRSPKLEAFRRVPSMAWTFHDPVQQVQLRARAEARVHVNDAVSESAWETVPEVNRRNYCGALVPGTPVDGPGIPHRSRLFGNPHFAVIVTTVSVFDWLWLALDGHRRARFRHEVTSAVTAEWLAP